MYMSVTTSPKTANTFLKFQMYVKILKDIAMAVLVKSWYSHGEWNINIWAIISLSIFFTIFFLPNKSIYIYIYNITIDNASWYKHLKKRLYFLTEAHERWWYNELIWSHF